jgi:hypothetical protein
MYNHFAKRSLILTDVLDGVFILLLGLIGNWCGELFNCNLRRLFSTNMLAKHILLLFIIFFSVNYSNKTVEHPVDTFKKSILIYTIFIMFTKTNRLYAVLNISIISIIYTLELLNKFYIENDEKKNANIIDGIEICNYLLFRLVALLLVIGFITYFLNKKREKKNFSYITFFFGTVKCSKMQ